MNRKKIKKFIPLGAFLMPLLAFAQGADLTELIATIKKILGTLVPLLVILAAVIFIWGVVTFITAAGNEEKRKTGRDRIIWGLVGLFVIIAFWGIVAFIANTIGVPSDAPTFVSIPVVSAL